MALPRSLPVCNAFLQTRFSGQLAHHVLTTSTVPRRLRPRLDHTSRYNVPILIQAQLGQSRHASCTTCRDHTQKPPHRTPFFTLTLSACQARKLSTTPYRSRDGGDSPSRAQPPPSPPRGRLQIFRLLFRALGGSFKSLFTPFRGQTLRKLFQSNPEELILALAV